MATFYKVPFNDSSESRIYPKSVADRALLFEGLEQLEVETSVLQRMGSGLSFSFVTRNIEIATLEEYNYVIDEGYHMFVETIVDKNKGQLEANISLKLDVFAQYFIEDQLNNNKVNVTRTHLDRFKKVGDNFTYDFRDEMLVAEDINIVGNDYKSERVVRTNNASFSNNNFLISEYPFYAITIGDGAYTEGGGNTRTRDRVGYNLGTGPSTAQSIQLPFTTVYLPIPKDYNGTIRIIADGQDETKTVTEWIEYLNSANIIDAKIVRNPTFELSPGISLTRSSGGNYTFTIDDNADNQYYEGTTNLKIPAGYTHSRAYLTQDLTFTSGAVPKLSDQHQVSLTLADIQSQNYEPKIFQYYHYDLITGSYNETYKWDLLQGEDFEMTAYNPSTTTGDNISFTTTAGKYNRGVSAGAFNTVSDNSVPYLVSQWEQYRSDKKLASSDFLALGGGASKAAATGAVAGSVVLPGLGTAVGAVVGGGLSFASAATSIVERKDIKTAASNIGSTGGDITLDYLKGNLNSVLATVGPTDHEEEEITEFLYKYGYSYNKITSIKPLINTRENYNFIQINTEPNKLFNDNIPNVMHQTIVNKLKMGVRLHHNFESIDNEPITNNEVNLNEL